MYRNNEPSINTPAAIDAIRERRGDHNTAATVSRGIFLASYFGTPAGAKFMATFGVPIDVSLRVLSGDAADRRPHYADRPQ